MRKLLHPTILLVVGSLFVASIATASGGPPGGGFYTGQTIQNVGGTTANVVVTVYDSSSANTYTANYSIASGASQTFFASDVPGVPNGFRGSAVVSSDQPIKAIVNVTNRLVASNGIAGGTAAAQYGGVDSSKTGTTLSFPLAKGAFFNKTTAFYIQNAGSASATFTAVFLMGTSLTDPAPVAYTYTLPTALNLGQMAVVIPADAGAPSGRIGSVTVTSAQSLAGTVLEYDPTTSPALILQGATGFTANDYDTRVLFPVVKKQLSGRSTGLQVQNVSSSSVNVTMVYRGAGGTCAPGTVFTEPVRTLQPKQSTTYLDSSLLSAGCLATGEATATGNIAGVVNESFLPCGAGCTQRSTTYSAFPAVNATTKVVAPVFKEDFFGKRTGLSVQNIGTASASVQIVFQEGATTWTYSASIPTGSSLTLLDMTNTSVFPDGNWTGGAGGRLPNSKLVAVTITSNQPIIAIANEAPLPGTLQDNINYEASNVTP